VAVVVLLVFVLQLYKTLKEQQRTTCSKNTPLIIDILVNLSYRLVLSCKYTQIYELFSNTIFA